MGACLGTEEAALQVQAGRGEVLKKGLPSPEAASPPWSGPAQAAWKADDVLCQVRSLTPPPRLQRSAGCSEVKLACRGS